MGTLLTQLRKDNMVAMKEKDTIRKGVLSLLISAIALAEKEQGEVLSETQELTYVQKELKQTKEALEETPSDRTDLIEETKKKIEILESYLPKQLSEEEVKKAIEDFLAKENLEPIKKNMGAIMKGIMALYQGQTDGKTVNRVLSELLK